MFGNILVCLDGSRLAEQILPFAMEQARRFEGKLTLLRVIIPMTPTWAIDEPPSEKMIEMQGMAETEAASYLEGIVNDAMKKEKVKAAYSVLEGTPGETIVNFANNSGADLIAIATHGEGGFKRLLFGSVADYVLRNCDLPILVIRPVGK